MVARQVDALTAWDPGIAAIYRELGAVAIELARAQAKADPKALDAIARTLGTTN